MKAIIMAGGKGTRISTVLRDIPKPMVSIKGKPLLEYQIENLQQNGVTDIILVVGYKAQVIMDYFGDGSNRNIRLSYFVEEHPLGTAGSFPYLKDYLDEDFYLIYGDLFLNIDLKKMLQFHKQSNALITLFAHPNSHPHDSDLIEIDGEHRVISWYTKNSPRNDFLPNLVNAGVYVCSPQILEHEETLGKKDFEREYVMNWIERKKVYAYRSSEYVKDIGTPERFKKVENDIEKNLPQKRNLKYQQKCIFLDRDGTINRYVGLLKKADEFELEDTVSEAIRKINESDYLCIVVTNQPVIARGECSFEELQKIHYKMQTLLGKQGAYIDSLYVCPHHPDGGYIGEVVELKKECNCRKPKTGMLEKASKDFNIDLSKSWIIGDAERDILMGINAEMSTALVLTGEIKKPEACRYSVKITGQNLISIVDQILEY